MPRPSRALAALAALLALSVTWTAGVWAAACMEPAGSPAAAHGEAAPTHAHGHGGHAAHQAHRPHGGEGRPEEGHGPGSGSRDAGPPGCPLGMVSTSPCAGTPAVPATALAPLPSAAEALAFAAPGGVPALLFPDRLFRPPRA